MTQVREELDKVLVKNDDRRRISNLKYRLLKAGYLEAKCSECEITEWRGFTGLQLPLVIDHIDGDPGNNLLENLRALCGNCNMLTDTYCGKNKTAQRRGRGGEVAIPGS